MGGQLDGNFLPGSLPHKFILTVTLIIWFVVNNFFSLSTETWGKDHTIDPLSPSGNRIPPNEL